MADAQFRFRIYSTDGATVETTFNTSQIEHWEEVGGQEVRPLLGRAEARPWFIDVADISTAVMSVLADTSGRLDQISRLADFQRNLDSSGWRTLGTGRIADVLLNPSVGSFRFVMEDENLIARRSMIFQRSTTVFLYPPGLREEWCGFRVRQTGDARLISRSGNLTLLRFENDFPISRPALRNVRNDYTPNFMARTDATGGNFRDLRFRSSSGTDFEVFGFAGGQFVSPWDHIAIIDRSPAEILPIRVWIVDPSSQLGTSTDVTDGKLLRTVFLHMGSTHDPTPELPYHVGGANGVHPFQLVRDIYDGTYGSVTIRYDSTALNNLINNKSFPIVWFRITEPAVMQDWLEDHIYGPFGVLPFVNSEGRIEPQITTLPTSDIANPSALFSFTSTNLRPPHPSWAHTRRDAATVLRYHYQWLQQVSDYQAYKMEYEVASDLLVAHPDTREYQHDRVGIIGRHVVDYPFDGVLAPYGVNPYTDRSPVGPFSIQAREVFDRYGDGPVYGECYGMTSGTSDVSPGDFVYVELDTFPNPAIQSRGNARLVQIIGRRDTPEGPIFDWADAGSSGQSLSAPTLGGFQGLGTPEGYHAVTVNVSNVTTDGGFRLELAASASTVSSGSTAWTPKFTTDSSGSFQIKGLASGTTYWVRAQNRKFGRIRSAWTYSTANAQTVQLTAPSGIGATDITSKNALIQWTNSTVSTGYELDILASTAGGTLTSTAILQPGRTNYRLQNLSSGTTYTVGIRYRDRFGGFSPTTSVNFETLNTTTLTADSITDIYLIYGSDSTASSSIF